ncbi:MAG: S-methyl-5'-thioadenosine phosphorylase [Candidatus Omnitrophica bacterium]|nr:S-methyl-5'-thioadenosine phosphorylase [Candidatus Omnitrophota bacterium]
MTCELGVLGGSGFYRMEGLEILEERFIETPFGAPSDKVVIGRLEGREVAFLARHGRSHQFNPTHVPYLANLWALKSLGVKWLVSVSAVGSLREEIAPRHVVIPDQIIDRTKHRPNSFFDPVAVHVGFADPYCPVLSGLLAEAAETAGITTHRGGTYVCMEGPLFSSRAESNLYRSWGASVIGMTALPEAKLAREAEIAYAAFCFATDYDCWHHSEEEVTVEMVVGHLRANAEAGAGAVRHVAARVGQLGPSFTHTALDTALLTDTRDYPPHTLDKVRLLLQRVRPGV